MEDRSWKSEVTRLLNNPPVFYIVNYIRFLFHFFWDWLSILLLFAAHANYHFNLANLVAPFVFSILLPPVVPKGFLWKNRRLFIFYSFGIFQYFNLTYNSLTNLPIHNLSFFNRAIIDATCTTETIAFVWFVILSPPENHCI